MEESIGRIRFGNALIFAGIFKVLAVITLIGGFLAAVVGGITLQEDAIGTGIGDDVIVFVAASWAGTLVTSSLLAFFGYVIEILVETYEQVWHGRLGEFDEDDTD